MKKGALLSLILAATSAASLLSAPANASTWHKGTPAVLRGKYYADYHNQTIVGAMAVIRKNNIRLWVSNEPVRYGHNVRYRVIGKNKFIIKHDDDASGIYLGGKNITTTITKVGKNIKIKEIGGTFKPTKMRAVGSY